MNVKIPSCLQNLISILSVQWKRSRPQRGAEAARRTRRQTWSRSSPAAIARSESGNTIFEKKLKGYQRIWDHQILWDHQSPYFHLTFGWSKTFTAMFDFSQGWAGMTFGSSGTGIVPGIPRNRNRNTKKNKTRPSILSMHDSSNES